MPPFPMRPKTDKHKIPVTWNGNAESQEVCHVTRVNVCVCLHILVLVPVMRYFYINNFGEDR